MELREALLLVLGGGGLLWYLACVIMLGNRPLNPGEAPGTFRTWQANSVSILSVALATFVGMLLGLQQVTSEQSGTVTAAPAIQWCAASLYVLSLFIATGFWLKHKDATDATIQNLAKSILGLFVGCLSILLNVPR